MRACVIVRGEWSGGGGGGGNWSQRAAFRMNGGGGRPPRAYAGSGADRDSIMKSLYRPSLVSYSDLYDVRLYTSSGLQLSLTS